MLSDATLNASFGFLLVFFLATVLGFFSTNYAEGLPNFVTRAANYIATATQSGSLCFFFEIKAMT